MALQQFTEVDRAVSTVVPAQELSAEEYQKRLKAAEELQAKLTYITEKARRREMLRLARIDEQAAQSEESAAFQKRRAEQQEGDEARTAKRREKRQKKKKKPLASAGAQLGNALDALQSSDSDIADQQVLD